MDTVRVNRLLRPNLSLLMCLALSAAGCGPAGTGEREPEWLQSRIREMRAEADPSVPAYVARAEYRGATVYYTSPTTPDGLGCLYDTTGTLLCHPDGGMDGRGDEACPDFFATRTNVREIWRARR